MKKIGSILFHRVALAAVGILLQLGVLIIMMQRFSEYFIPFYWCAVAASIAVVVWIVSSPSNGGYKIGWIILILIFPVFGGVFYVLCRGDRTSPKMHRRLQEMESALFNALREDFQADEVARLSGANAGNQARYLERHARCPAYKDTLVTYYPLGDDCFRPMLDALAGAKKYIFLEYFIIHPGAFWNRILDILKQKVAQGVDVRVMYDDIGSMYTLPSHYDKELQRLGIQAVDFNRFAPVVSTVMNNRDHRKICVVDGEVAFTGGINLADEYINEVERFGHWKDNVIRLEGPAAWSMAVMFLSMWGFATGRTERITNFKPRKTAHFPDNGWVQPYTDCPWDNEPVGETVYLNLIGKAQRYLYITTPYLIIDEAMNTALVAAAKSGVDVRIMTPHIPDKKVVFQMTRAHYEPLLRGGVKIYEYTPGFIHAKSFVVDDRYATVGSANLDYRSLFLHFENGVLLTDNPAVEAVRRDFVETLEKCQPYTLTDCQRVGIPLRLLRSLLRVFAPLL